MVGSFGREKDSRIEFDHILSHITVSRSAAGETLDAPGAQAAGPTTAAAAPRSPVAAAHPRPGPQGDRRSAPLEPPFRIYMTNLPYETDEAAIEQFFRDLHIRDIVLTRFSDTQKLKGVFVEFETAEEMREALTANGAYFARRPVTVRVAEPREGGGWARGGRRDDRARMWNIIPQ